MTDWSEYWTFTDSDVIPCSDLHDIIMPIFNPVLCQGIKIMGTQYSFFSLEISPDFLNLLMILYPVNEAIFKENRSEIIPQF